MVIDEKTLKPLHDLTPEGERLYRELIAKKADEIIFKKTHPFLYLLNKLRQMSKIDMKFIEIRYNTIMKEIEENRK